MPITLCVSGLGVLFYLLAKRTTKTAVNILCLVLFSIVYAIEVLLCIGGSIFFLTLNNGRIEPIVSGAICIVFALLFMAVAIFFIVLLNKNLKKLQTISIKKVAQKIINKN